MKLNFNDTDSIKGFLKRDKHKLLEGMAVEEIFIQDIANPNNWNTWMSKGWWSIRNPLNYNQYMLFHVTSHLPLQADIEIYKLLQKKNIVSYHVLLVESNLLFLDLTVQTWQAPVQRNYISESEFLKNYSTISRDREILKAEDSYRVTFNQDRAISFFESQSLLEEVALQRYFANYFLTVCLNAYPVNIDAFMFFDDGPAVLEIKYKYPDSNENYGINKGQAALFRWLLEVGFNVNHYIAANPTKKKKYGVFDIISSDKVRKEFYWKYKKLTVSELENNHSVAPKETNIAGKEPVKYIPIPASNFSNTLVPVGTQIDSKIIPKESCPRTNCNGYKVLSNGRNGYFWGCTNYLNHTK